MIFEYVSMLSQQCNVTDNLKQIKISQEWSYVKTILHLFETSFNKEKINFRDIGPLTWTKCYLFYKRWRRENTKMVLKSFCGKQRRHREHCRGLKIIFCDSFGKKRQGHVVVNVSLAVPVL